MSELELSSVDGQLASRLEFETLIADTSAAVLAAPLDRLDGVVEQALERVRRFFQADRAALLSVSADQQVINVRLASYGEGVSPVSRDIDLAPHFPWARQRSVVERTAVRVARMDDLPPEAETDRAAWDAMQARSALILPVETGGAIGHLVVLQAVYAECSWPDALVTRLRLLGELLVGALERQAMFDELSEAEERVSLAADSAEAGLWTLDYGTGVFWASPRTRMIFGFAPDEVIDMPRLAASVHPDDWEIVSGGIERATRERVPVDVEYRIVVPGEGRMRWVAARGQRHYTSSGEPSHLMGFCIDVSARKQAEEAQRRSEARLESGADLAGLAFYEVDFRERVAFVDDRFRSICGMPPERAQGLQPVEFWAEQIHPEDRARVMDAAHAIARGHAEPHRHRIPLPAPGAGGEVDPPRRPRQRARRRRTRGADVRRPPRQHGAPPRRRCLEAIAGRDRAVEGPTPGGERLPQGRSQGEPVPGRGDRPEPRHPAAAASGGAGGPHGFLGPHPRRNRQRQGTRRPGHPPTQSASRPRGGQDQLRGAAGRARGKRTVRPREGRVHRGPDAADRPLRSGRRLDALPRRGRRIAARPAGETAARARDRRVRAARKPEAGQGRRPRDRGHQPRPDRGDPERSLPPGPLLPSQRLPAPGAAVARAAPKTSRSWSGPFSDS